MPVNAGKAKGSSHQRGTVPRVLGTETSPEVREFEKDSTQNSVEFTERSVETTVLLSPPSVDACSPNRGETFDGIC